MRLSTVIVPDSLWCNSVVCCAHVNNVVKVATTREEETYDFVVLLISVLQECFEQVMNCS